MGDLAQIYETYYEIENLLSDVSAEYDISPRGSGIDIDVPGVDVPLRLDKKKLEALDDRRLVNNVSNLVYHHDCGFSFNTYSEFFITITHPEYFDLGLPSEWPAQKPLNFKIGDATIVVGEASPLIALLMEPYYRDSDVHPDGFNTFACIGLRNIEPDRAEEWFHKALYYINSHYLKPFGLVAALRHLESNFDDPLGIVDGSVDPQEAFKRIVRTRKRNRLDFMNIDPLILYNHACVVQKSDSFISYYRVLEFFFTRAMLAKIDVLRNDRSQSSEDIWNMASARNEEQQLNILIDAILTASQKTKLFEYAKKHSLVKNSTLKNFVSGLYSFRNSLVHAKEKHVSEAMLPNPFSENKSVEKWTYIVSVCAERAIRQLNER